MNIDEMRFYTVAEVAGLLRVDHNTVRRRIRAGELEGFKIGDTLRVEEQALVDYLARCKQAAKTA